MPDSIGETNPSSSGGSDLVCASGGQQKICIPHNYQKYDLPTSKGLAIPENEIFLKNNLVKQGPPMLQLELISKTFPRCLIRTLALLSMLISTSSGETLA